MFIERQPRLIRPANFPPGTPGRGAAVVESAKGARLLIVNVMGRIFMAPLDDPFAAVKRELGLCPLGEKCDASVIDIHAEAIEREMGAWPFRRRQGEPGRRHAHPCAERRSPDPRGRDGFRHRRGHDRRLQFGDRHGEGRTAAPFHQPHPLRPVRAGGWGRRRCAALRPRSAPTAARKPFRRSGSAAFSRPPRPISGPESR